jgi:hypothetical protein
MTATRWRVTDARRPCAVEVGATCGDGIVNAACGEQCDPPGAGCSLICTAGDGVLGRRTLTFGGAFFSSALGTSVPLGSLTGSMELIGGTIGAGGIAPVEVAGPVFYTALFWAANSAPSACASRAAPG